ncbi:hypothetical protein EJ069_15790 [Mesorhizobium sp. M2A.F.Ca.ET.043.05.1.1]|uniref:hypothetical protein n=1 Tax=Mesorhizobium sp. M2A.F.Ca.ET.043.05.1.1 TaxID=2493671 RepID=UPI000F75953C|nr:hypothetical protein [Mesorhizobium sp. M2A.F.Ca.ET.043.05.1.1]AZO16048.1 hypothetical protein EJ069_15790 [Mesorhizobium sp. M2A.F.Ca.ET.043.05.1.1]
MKFRVYHAYDENRHGTASIVRATQDEIDDYFWKDAFDHSEHLDADTVEELKALFNNDVSEAMASCRPYTSWSIDTDGIDIAPTVPKDAIEAARTAVEALAFARDCLRQLARRVPRTRLGLHSPQPKARPATLKIVHTTKSAISANWQPSTTPRWLPHGGRGNAIGTTSRQRAKYDGRLFKAGMG